jgi:O-antigen/teichoic acid export membrane protein
VTSHHDGHHSEDLRFKAVSGVLWTALQKWSVRLSTFVAFLLLARLLTPRDFGIVDLAIAIIALLQIVADAGFATYLVQARELTDSMKNTAFVIATGSGITLTLLLIGLSFPLADALNVPEFTRVLPLLAVSLVFVGLSSVPAALLTRELRFQQLAMRQVIANVVSVIVAIVLAFAGAGVWALVAQNLVRQVVATAVLMTATDFRPRRDFSGGEAKKMLAYSTKAMGVTILSQSSGQAEILLIGAIAGPVPLGLWTIATRLVNVLSDLLGTVIGTVSVPLFARVQSDAVRLGRAIFGTGSLSLLLLAPALISLSLVSSPLIPQVFGHQWQRAAIIGGLLAVRGLPLAHQALDRAVLLSTGRAGGELRFISAATVLHCGLVAAFAHYGVRTLAWIVLAEAVVLVPIRPLLVHRWLGVPYRPYIGIARVDLATVVAGLITLGAVHGLHAHGSKVYLVVALVGGASYAALLALIARPALREAQRTVRLVRDRRRRRAAAVVST